VGGSDTAPGNRSRSDGAITIHCGRCAAGQGTTVARTWAILPVPLRNVRPWGPWPAAVHPVRKARPVPRTLSRSEALRSRSLEGSGRDGDLVVIDAYLTGPIRFARLPGRSGGDRESVRRSQPRESADRYGSTRLRLPRGGDAYRGGLGGRAYPRRLIIGNPSSGVPAGGYLGTFHFRASPDAAGTFHIAQRAEATLLRDSANRPIEPEDNGGVDVDILAEDAP